MEAKVGKDLKPSIRNKIIGNYLFIFIIAIFIFEIFLMYSMRYYYYSTVEGLLRSQGKYSQELYESNLADESLEKVILEDKDQFYRHNKVQVQVIDNFGVLLLDSAGTDLVGSEILAEDVSEAISGKSSRSIKKIGPDNENSMSYSMPLNSRDKQVGIIRLTTSLKFVDQIVLKRNAIFIGAGIILIVFLIVVSVIIADSIVKPINELTKVAIDLAGGNMSRQAVVHSDDEIGNLARTINHMSESIKEKEQLKNDFISSVSHELRTPLTSIKGWAVTLQDNTEDEITIEGLHIIEKESDRLKDMVEDLLDFSSLTSARIKFNKEMVNIIEIGRSIHRQLSPRAANLGIDLVINYDEEELMILADKNRIRQVMINILDNALKFTEDKGTVMLNIFEEENDVVLEFIDTGIGIDKDEIQLITGKFFKGKDSNSHIGLGLSISEEIVKGHGGSMTIESQLGKGTKITCVLPKGGKDEE